MIKLAVVAAVVGAAVVFRVRRRRTLQREAIKRGWDYRERDDELPSTWTMPPFVHLPSPGDAGLPLPRRRIGVEEVISFRQSGTLALSMVVTETVGEQAVAAPNRTYHVVALHTRQGLPRTIARTGVDVYVLPAFEGLHRVLEPKRWTRRGILSILSEEPDEARSWPFDRVVGDLGRDAQQTLVADGDWIYVYRPGQAGLWQIDAMIVTVEKLARGIESAPWPPPEEPSRYVYGAV